MALVAESGVCVCTRVRTYILSIGPVTWLTLKIDPDLDRLPTTVVSWAYWPVFATRELTGTEMLYVRYISLFVRHPILERKRTLNPESSPRLTLG